LLLGLAGGFAAHYILLTSTREGDGCGEPFRLGPIILLSEMYGPPPVCKQVFASWSQVCCNVSGPRVGQTHNHDIAVRSCKQPAPGERCTENGRYQRYPVPSQSSTIAPSCARRLRPPRTGSSARSPADDTSSRPIHSLEGKLAATGALAKLSATKSCSRSCSRVKTRRLPSARALP